MTDARLKALLVDYSRRLHARGWVANHDGNLSVRDGAGRYLCTPTATSKAEVTTDTLLVVDDAGARVTGTARPFSEIGLHLTVFKNRSDVNAVIHAHSPTATGFAVAGVSLEQPILAEAVVSLGAGVPTVPWTAAGAAACNALAPFTVTHDAVLLGNHGVLAWGADVEQAYLRLELVEHLARVALVAHQLGGARPLPASALPPLLEARRKAGLGAAASRSAATAIEPRAVVACAPPPEGSDVVLVEKRPKSSVLPGPGDLASIIRQEIAAALKK